MYVRLKIFKVAICFVWRGVGPGLSPGPWSFELLYDPIVYMRAVGAWDFDITLGHITCAICP
jgi:hypothetical protein